MYDSTDYVPETGRCTEIKTNKGRGNLSRVLFGSVAQKVFRHSPVPAVGVGDPETFKGRQ